MIARSFKSATLALFLVSFISGTVWANPRLGLGDASGSAGDEVTIPLYLTNETGIDIAAASSDISYDEGVLTPLDSTIGPTGRAAGKDIYIKQIMAPGLYRVSVLSLGNLTPIADGIVANVIFRINPGVSPGTYQLNNKPSCSTPQGTPVAVPESYGFVEVNDISTVTSSSSTSSAATTSTTTSASGGGGGGGGGGGSTSIMQSSTSTTVQSSSSSTAPAETTSTTVSPATTTVVPHSCSVSITPASISVASGSLEHFTAGAAPEGCAAPRLAWSVESSIGSTIDDSGNYQAGDNNTGAEVTDTILVVDTANNSGSRATVTVQTGGISRIAPATISSSWWRPRLHLLIINSQQGGFKMSSALSFKPAGDITPLVTLGSGSTLIAIVSVKPTVQGHYDVFVSTENVTYGKNNCLTVKLPSFFPGLADERVK